MASAAEEREREVADLRETRATHLRVMAREQGRRDGWYAALDEVRKIAAEAFMRDDDAKADLIRGIARDLGKATPRHPYLARVDASEQQSMEVVDRAALRLAELTSED